MDVTLEIVNQTNQRLVANIQKRMKTRDWKVPQLAKATGLSASGLYGVVEGSRWPNPDNLEKIAKALGAESAELLQGDAPPLRKPSSKEALEMVRGDLERLAALSPGQRALFDELPSVNEDQARRFLKLIKEYKSTLASNAAAPKKRDQG